MRGEKNKTKQKNEHSPRESILFLAGQSILSGVMSIDATRQSEVDVGGFSLSTALVYIAYVIKQSGRVGSKEGKPRL